MYTRSYDVISYIIYAWVIQIRNKLLTTHWTQKKSVISVSIKECIHHHPMALFYNSYNSCLTCPGWKAVFIDGASWTTWSFMIKSGSGSSKQDLYLRLSTMFLTSIMVIKGKQRTLELVCFWADWCCWQLFSVICLWIFSTLEEK